MPGALTEGSISEEMRYVKDFKVKAADVRRYYGFITCLCLLPAVSLPYILPCSSFFLSVPVSVLNYFFSILLFGFIIIYLIF